MNQEMINNLKLSGNQTAIFEMALKELKDTFDQKIEISDLLAKQKYAYYRSLINAGFDDYKAFELTKIY